MNIIKNFLFLAVVFSIVNSVSINEMTAQDSSTSAEKKEQNKDKRKELKAAYQAMLDSLNLTEQQREDVDFINTKYKAQMQQIRQNSEGDRETMRPKMMELRDKQNAELKEIFSEEQFAEYQKWMKENRSRGRGNRPSGGRK
jgi:hypothetical protein